MSDAYEVDWSSNRRERLGEQLISFGRMGFYIQLILLTIPLLFVAYMTIFGRSSNPPSTRLDLGRFISLTSFVIMAFTTFWFYRYIQLGRQLRKGEHPVPRSRAVTTIWVGFGAGWIGVIFSVLLLLAAAWQMMFVLLSNPQSGLLVAPNLGTNPGYSISAIDAVSLTLLVISLTAELIVLGLSLWLLFTMTWPSSKPSSVETGELPNLPAT